MSVDEILTRRKAEIQLRVREGAQQILAAEGAGIQILSVSQERTAPPEKVADAFRAVTSARADRGRMIAEAQGYREDLLPRARGEAATILQQAQADAYALVADAQGRAERFENIRAQTEKAPELTRERLHAEMAEEVLGRTRPIIVSPDSTDDLRLIEERP
jgi:membrane protease subunit HflK